MEGVSSKQGETVRDIGVAMAAKTLRSTECQQKKQRCNILFEYIRISL